MVELKARKLIGGSWHMICGSFRKGDESELNSVLTQRDSACLSFLRASPYFSQSLTGPGLLFVLEEFHQVLKQG